MRNQQYVDMNSGVAFELDKETQEIMFKHSLRQRDITSFKFCSCLENTLIAREKKKSKTRPQQTKCCVYQMVTLNFFNDSSKKLRVSRWKFVPIWGMGEE